MIKPLIESELYALPVPELVSRMDAIIETSLVERGMPSGWRDEVTNMTVKRLLSTKRISAFPEAQQRRLAYIGFSFLVQLEMLSAASGMSNSVLYNDRYHEKNSWVSPAFRFRHGALNQYGIVSSRIAMEIFMDLLYCIEKGERLKSKKSKLAAFKNFIVDCKNPFHYFACVLLNAYHFDRTLRTPEVHGTPSLTNRILLLQVPGHDEINESHKLSNVLMNCWQPLCELLNGLPVGYTAFDEISIDWYETYLRSSTEQVAAKLEALFIDIS